MRTNVVILINYIDVSMLDPHKIITDFLTSKSNIYIRENAKKILDRIAISQFDYKKLCKIFKTNDDFYLKNAAQRYLVKYFGKKLGYRTLIKFLESNDFYIKNGVRRLLLEGFSSQLKYQILLSFLRSDDFYIKNSARRLLGDIDSSKFDYHVLVKLLKSDCEDIQNEVQKIINIILYDNKSDTLLEVIYIFSSKNN